MNRNDSPTAQAEEDLPRLRLCPRHLCGSTDDAVWRGIDAPPPRVLIQHLIMRKKCFFFFPQLKPQTTFEDKRQTANSGAPRNEGERDGMKKKKQMTVGKGKKKIRGPV